MPSPFAGMDPFLESPIYFPDLHDNLIAYLRESLQARLPEPYYACSGDRIWVEVSRWPIGPDLKVLRPPPDANGASPSGSGGVAVAEAIRTRPVVVHVPHDEFREPFLDLYTRKGNKEYLVTHIEVLSLANKTPGEHGRDLYLRKQREVLNSKTHLVEIDLLRSGAHTTAVPFDRMLEETGPFDYHVCVHHFDNLEDYFVYPVRVDAPLPELAIPLLPGDGTVAIDLQAVFERTYDTGPYRRRLHYAEESIEPPLDTERAAWATRLLRAKGLLPAS